MDADFIAGVAGEVRAHLASTPACHDFDHTLRVVHNALKLADALPEADRDVVHLGALLHDIARPEELRTEGGIDHAEAGGEMARRLLLRRGASPALADRVAACVRRHRYRDEVHPETLEEKIVYDADKLDSLGAVGIGRAFLFAGRCGARLHNRAETALASPPYGEEDTAWREYLVKLRHLPGKMLTSPGRETARTRAEFMAEFFIKLEQEVFPE